MSYWVKLGTIFEEDLGGLKCNSGAAALLCHLRAGQKNFKIIYYVLEMKSYISVFSSEFSKDLKSVFTFRAYWI